MRTSYLAITMSVAFIALFALLSALLVIENHSVNYIAPSNGVVTLQKNIPQDSKVKLDSYQKDSSESIGVLITTNNLDSAFKLVSSTGATLKRNQIGRVIAANVPQNQIDSLALQNDITQILPNRVVKAFSINEIYETNAQVFQNSGYTGKGIVVAVLDTGINWNNIINAQDFVGEGTTDDKNGHGTKIAEIISAMAPDVKFINAKVLDKDGSGSEASVISGINYAVDNNADIISLSLGGYFDDVNSPLVSAVEDAINKGVIVVVASGNCGTQGNCGNFVGVATPGNSPNAITVGAVNGNSAVSYSAGKNYGNYIKPDITAPVSANSLSGTSASTPFVSGAAALILQRNKLNPVQVKSLIEKNALDLGVSGKDVQFGSGKLNLNFSDLTPLNNKITYEPISETNTNRKIFASSAITVNTHPTWNVLNAWSELGSYPKYGFDVLNDKFMMITGATDSSYNTPLMLWNGTTWRGINGTLASGIESMYAVDIYDKNFAIIGGEQSLHSKVYIWNGVNLAGYSLGDSEGTSHRKIISVLAKSPSEGYALDSNGRIYGFNGVSWSNITQKIGDMDSVLTARNISYSMMDQNNIMLGYGQNPYDTNSNGTVFFYNGVSWSNTNLPITLDCKQVKKVQMLNTNLAYAICTKTLWKWNGVSWNLAYTGTYDLNDFSFADDNFGFITSANRTIIKWDGTSWTPSQYTGQNVTGVMFAGQPYDRFDFEKVHLVSRNQGYASGIYFYGNLLFGDGVINSNWVWDGSSWRRETANFTSPLPSGLASNGVDIGNLAYLQTTFRLSPWKFIDASGETYAMGYDDIGKASPNIFFGKNLRIGYNTAIMKVKKGFVFNVPSQNIVKDGTKIINLANYTSSNKTVSYSITYEDSNQVDCSVAGSSLTITGKNGFTGLGLCTVKADNSESYKISDVSISVGNVPVLDVYSETNDISFDSSGNPIVKIHSVSGSGSYGINIDLYEMANGKVVKTQSFPYTLDTSVESNTFNPSFSVSRGDDVVVVIDSQNVISESDKSNNKARNNYKKEDIYLNINSESVYTSVINNYLTGELSNYNVVNSNSSANYVINVGYNLGNSLIGCKQGTVYGSGKSLNYAHVGAVFSVKSGTKTIVNVCGARIEGLVSGLRILNKENLANNKEILIDKDNTEALATLDFIRNQGNFNSSVINKALYGGLLSQDLVVKTNAGTYLRLKHYKPILSQSFLDYLLGIDPVHYNGNPVVMAGGLWSDINAWDQAGRETSIGMDDHVGTLFDSIKYVPRDVWLIELTGGPGTECSNCADYTYGDVYSKYWPALVGGVLKLTGKSQVDYVGHSNGGRTALDGLKNYSTGMINAGKLSDGTPYNLPVNPVGTFIGVGVPGALDSNNPVLNSMRSNGGSINTQLINQNIHHVTIGDLIARGIVGFQTNSFSDAQKISANLWKKYFQIANSTLDTQPGTGISLSKTLIIGGTLFGTHDEIVPVSDVDAIYGNIGVNVGIQNKKVLMHQWDGHMGMTESKDIKRAVKQFLNDDPLTGKIQNQVNG